MGHLNINSFLIHSFVSNDKQTHKNALFSNVFFTLIIINIVVNANEIDSQKPIDI